MAGGENDPPDKSDNKFPCCNKKRFSIKICLICESAFHSSCFKRKGNNQEVSSSFVICDKHNNVDLTSKVSENNTLSEDARKIIAQVKLYEKSKLEQETINELSQSILNTGEDISQDDLDQENGMTEREAALKRENTLLKRLVAEMQDKNEILKKLFNNQQQTIPTTTFAQVARGNSQVKTMHVPQVIVKAKGNLNKETIIKKVTNSIRNNVIVPVDKILERKDGTIAIRCKQSTQVTTAEELLADSLGGDFEVQVETLKNPRMMIVGIDSDLPLETLIDDINERNFKSFESDCVGIHSFRSKKSNLLNVIVELSPELYRSVRDNNNKVYVGYQKCRAYDDLNVKPCYKCGRFGHSGAKCENPPCCLYCAGPHEAGACRNFNRVNCPNCAFANSKYRVSKDTNHWAGDCVKCDILKAKINKIIKETNYPIKPIVPSLMGKPAITLNTAGTEEQLGTRGQRSSTESRGQGESGKVPLQKGNG